MELYTTLNTITTITVIAGVTSADFEMPHAPNR